MADVAPQVLQLGPDGLRLDPLGDDLDAELMGQIDGVADDGPERWAAGYRPDDGDIELELIHGPAAQALQGGEARSEVPKSREIRTPSSAS